MKNIIHKSSDILIGIGVFFGILIVVISAFKYGQSAAVIGVIIFILFTVVFSSFLIYILIDIRDKIAENNLLLKNNREWYWLNHKIFIVLKIWWRRAESNRSPKAEFL